MIGKWEKRPGLRGFRWVGRVKCSQNPTIFRKSLGWATCHHHGSKLKSEEPWTVTRALEKGVLAGEWINTLRKVWPPEAVSSHWTEDQGEPRAGQGFRSGWKTLNLLPCLPDPNCTNAFVHFPNTDEGLGAVNSAAKETGEVPLLRELAIQWWETICSRKVSLKMRPFHWDLMDKKGSGEGETRWWDWGRQGP